MMAAASAASGDASLLHRAPLFLSVALLSAGCVGVRVVSDYSVDLIPRTPLNESPDLTPSALRLVLRDDRAASVFGLDDVDRDAVRDDLQPINNTYVGLLSTTTAGDALTALDVLAYGEVGPFTLARDDAPVAAEVLLAEVGRVGELERLAGDDSALGGAVAMTASGDVLLFGGHTTFEGDGAPTGRVLRLTDLNAGTWRFEGTGVLPTAARLGATATLVSWSGREAILVAGGRAALRDVSANIATAVYYTPDDDVFSWTDGAMRVARSDHRAVVLENGRVLLVGGYEGDVDGRAPDHATFEVFDPGFQVFNAGTTPLSVPGLGFGITAAGTEGVLVCGGHSVVDRDGVPTVVPTAACDHISPLGEVTQAAPLPVATTGLVLSVADERHIIATGGVVGEHPADTPAEASAQAWLYTFASDDWQPLPDLATARALHSAIAMPDGRVVIVGGTAQVTTGALGGPAAAVGPDVGCSEVYDPLTRTLSPGGCSGTGAGARPLVASQADHGAIVISGRDDRDGGGQSYGIVPFVPTL